MKRTGSSPGGGSCRGGRGGRRRHGRPRGMVRRCGDDARSQRLVMEASRPLVRLVLFFGDDDDDAAGILLFFLAVFVVVFANVVLLVGAFGGRQEVVTGLESVERVLRRVGRVEFDEERRRRRPDLGVVRHAAQVCNHRRLDVAAVVDFDAVLAREATFALQVARRERHTQTDKRHLAVRLKKVGERNATYGRTAQLKRPTKASRRTDVAIKC